MTGACARFDPQKYTPFKMIRVWTRSSHSVNIYSASRVVLTAQRLERALLDQHVTSCINLTKGTEGTGCLLPHATQQPNRLERDYCQRAFTLQTFHVLLKASLQAHFCLDAFVFLMEED
eukprot:1155621-Pelagomonas_calceolata.AAC.2